MNPVVGTLLMVGVTIALAAVLWFTVAGMIEIAGEDDTIDIDGVVIDRAEDPEHEGYWIIVEDWKNEDKYVITSKAVWLDHFIGDRFIEEDVPTAIVEEI